MTTFGASLVEPYFSLVRDGIKKLELRPEREKWARVRAEDQVRFANADATEMFMRTISKVVGFPNFASAVAEYGSALMPNLDGSPNEKILEAYLAIGDYAKWKGPVVVFFLE